MRERQYPPAVPSARRTANGIQLRIARTLSTPSMYPLGVIPGVGIQFPHPQSLMRLHPQLGQLRFVVARPPIGHRAGSR